MTSAIVAPTHLLVSLQAQADGSPSLWTMLPLWAIILVIFYLVAWLPRKKEMQKVAQFQAALKPGERVVTTGGIHGSIVKVDDEVVVLQVDENTKTRLKVARSAIAGYQGQKAVAPESQSS